MTIWFLSEQFHSFSIAGKLTAIASFILVILLITLLDIYVAKRHATNKSPTEQLAENRPDDNSRHTNCGGMPQHRKGGVAWHYPLSNILNNWRNNPIHYYSEHDGTTHNRSPPSGRTKPTRIVFGFSRSHIRTIVNKLRRRVNQSGKEPCRKWYPLERSRSFEV
jgi:hypothetical protein